MFNPIKWLLEKNEPNTKESTMPDMIEAASPETTAAVPVTTEVLAGGQSTPSTSVKDLTAALAFIDDGIKHLGDVAKSDLIALAQKYL